MKAVLVVDDSEEVRILVKKLLGRLELRILEASSKEELQNLIPLLKKLEKPPIVILDASFPNFGDGKEMAGVLRAKFPGVIIISHSGQEGHTWGDHNILKGEAGWEELPKLVERLL